MNLFARPLPDVRPANSRRVLWAFVALFVVGIGLRGIACIYTTGILHPDEHQQFIEQAYRMIHGYGKIFWEQERGMRHPLYQAFLAVPLRILEASGIRNPLVQSGVIRFIVAVLTLAAWAVFAWQFQRRGDTFTALLLMFVFALSPDLVHVHTHPLSEIAATIPFLLAVCCLERRPVLAGGMLGVCFAVRFQMGFLIGGMVFLAGLPDRFRLRGPFLRFALAALGTLIVLGFVDWFVLGWPFKSPVQYFYANIIQGMSRHWGVHPWYQYFEWLWEYGGLVVLALAALMIVGAYRERKLAFLLAVFAAAHIAVAHKEERFMLPIVPLALALVAVGLARLMAYIKEGWRPAAMVAVLAACAGLFALRLPNVQWEPDEGYRSASMLLYDAGQRDDLTGVGVLGIHLAFHGNFFFLQRDVHMLGVIHSDNPYFPDDPHLLDRRINYLITPPRFIEYYHWWRPVPIKSRGGWTLYRLDRSEK